jgi:hypothetical protein
MPFRTRLSFTRGTPRGLFGSVGLMAVHSWSASSCASFEPPVREFESRQTGQTQRCWPEPFTALRDGSGHQPVLNLCQSGGK